jgi:hypothetical protein
VKSHAWWVHRTIEFHVDAPESLHVSVNQIQNFDDPTIDRPYVCFRNSLLVFVPVLPQELAEVGSPLCEAKVVERIWPTIFIPRQSFARLYVSTGIVTIARWNEQHDSYGNGEEGQWFHGGKL